MEERFENFTILISKISKYIRKIKTEEVDEFNLKSPHVSCLYYLYSKRENITAKELSGITGEDKAAISRSLDYLEKIGLVECLCASEKKYKSPLRLTTKGEIIAGKIVDKIDKFVLSAGSDLKEEERVVLYKALNKISNKLQNICLNYGGNHDEC